MTTAPVSQPFTSGSFLFADTGIASALEASGAADVVRRQLAGFTQATRNEAVKEIERITAEVTNLNLIDVILDAVSTYRELRDAGMRTISAPDSSELVELIGHQVTLENQPSIQLIVNGKQVANVHLLLSLVIEIQALTATVRYGRLTALQIGRCDVGARRYRGHDGRVQAVATAVASLDPPRRWPPTGHTAPERRKGHLNIGNRFRDGLRIFLVVVNPAIPPGFQSGIQMAGQY